MSQPSGMPKGVWAFGLLAALAFGATFVGATIERDREDHQVPEVKPSATTMRTVKQDPPQLEAIDCEDLKGEAVTEQACVTFDEGKWVESTDCDQARNNCAYRSIKIILKIDPAADGNTWYVYEVA